MPMQAMGAVDAYGGRMSTGLYNSSISSYSPSLLASASTPPPPSSSSLPHSDHKTPSVRPKLLGPPPSAPPSTPTPTPTTLLDDCDPEIDAGGDAETETETETEGGWTTDDETTIRAGHSSAESESDNASLCSTGTEDGDGPGEDDDDGEGDLDGEVEEGQEVEIGDVFEGARHLDRVEDELRARVGNGETEGDAERGERTPEQKWKQVWDGGQAHIHEEAKDYAMAGP